MRAIYVDGLTNLSVSGQGLVKFDLGLASPSVDENGEQKLSWATTDQVVMPMEGFLRAFGIQEQVIKKLIDDGLIQQRTPNQVETPKEDTTPDFLKSDSAII